MTEIDDEMVDRAEASFVRNFRDPKIAFTTMDVRGLLEAALHPKPEPEIEVSEGMIEAAKIANPIWEWGPSITQRIKEIYRAMRAVEAQEGAAYAAKDAPLHERRHGLVSVLSKDTRSGEDRRDAPYGAKGARQGASGARAEQTTGGGVERRVSLTMPAPIQRGPGYGTGCIGAHQWRRSYDISCHDCGMPLRR